MGLDPRTAQEAAKWPVPTRKNSANALRGFDMGNNYPQIKAPTVIAHRDQDFASPIDSRMEPILKKLPSCTFNKLSGVNHFPPT
ncbi:alpha/beta hydrolase fold protein [Aspergillus sclerotialis]|uniref:Alpha/beta hydrolase fold protein n=1 Tax=Aspergillus sclerotialis TaxID=2070753 RepID=A0A3A2ZE53_9EURO|nr:alpha/beta hydrolase fold protein [Aspergillus sclerotialis]